jgi:hypothetical protein
MAGSGKSSGRLNRGKIMDILSFIQRKWDWVLTHDVFEKLRRNEPSAPPRVCQFGHAVFSGDKLCSYGHRVA